MEVRKYRSSDEWIELYRPYFCLSKAKLQDLVEDFLNSLICGLESHNGITSANICIQKPLKVLDSCIFNLPSGKEQGIHYAIDMGGTNLRCVRVELRGNGESFVTYKKMALNDLRISKHKAIENNINIETGDNLFFNSDIQSFSILDKLASATDMFDAISNFFYDFLVSCGDINERILEFRDNNEAYTTFNSKIITKPLSTNLNKNNENQLQKYHEKDLKYQSNYFSVAFTFSFPTTQLSIANAHLISWTKGIETGRATLEPVEGYDVGNLLNSAFNRNKIPAHCKCIINDTVGTLLSAMYDLNSNMVGNNMSSYSNNSTPRQLTSNPVIGIVIGTGINACYIEPMSLFYGYKGVIINTECGDFTCSNLPITDCDLVLDWFSDNRGDQQFEKMISGTYLGELCRLLFIRVLQDKAPSIFFQSKIITTEDIANIASFDEDNTSINIDKIQRFIKSKYNVILDTSSCNTIKTMAIFVLKRAAGLVATVIAALIKKIENFQNGITVAVDGSVWTRVPKFQNYTKENLNLILGEQVSQFIQFYEADDGSGKGAAILAATMD
ncbi:hexokinase family protein [Cryptosporidium muris RN66]|uniref:Phosphotransferase n=1 Tax=Cryptosporidium muris (strain RN66) TaxID=441375 RepID=B6ACV0_CRYMR|nr:hexokinase family protein [Cryptosporidium muris RN66]EEA05954.1 hexokinase family protein [Cryptosporidium muris RN66]|eukprot:XP_002140303.1 hexokinase family protein [Cryptosporidium muris RN66]